MNIRDLSEDVVSIAFAESGNEIAKVEQSIWETFKPLLNAGFKMRKFQKEYFRTKDSRMLQHAKKWEKEFDRLLADLQEQKNHPKLRL